jgi:hypothetical protein
VNATRSPKKATDWSGIKKANLLKKTQLSRHQSIDKKHFSIHVEIGGGLSIPFARELKSKNSGAFSERMICPFSKRRGLKGLKI